MEAWGIPRNPAALKYYPTVLLPATPMEFGLLNANILLADRSTNTIVKILLCVKIRFHSDYFLWPVEGDYNFIFVLLSARL